MEQNFAYENLATAPQKTPSWRVNQRVAKIRRNEIY